MLHEPATPSGKDPAAGYKKRLGVIMFIIYSIVYAGFVLINIVNPLAMDAIVMFGLNLACVYGFGLIVFALILAIIYNQMCSSKEKELAGSEQEGDE